jgi:hypothetical protein
LVTLRQRLAAGAGRLTLSSSVGVNGEDDQDSGGVGDRESADRFELASLFGLELELLSRFFAIVKKASEPTPKNLDG